MHQEYAVEPSAVAADWTTFRYLIEKFGFDRGRLISRFPIKWEKKVIAEAKRNEVPEIQLASIIERLRNAKRTRIADFGRGYRSDLNWIDNALLEHGNKPFHAIIHEGEILPDEFCISIAGLDEEEELVKAPQSQSIRRTSADIAAALLPLSITAKEIDIIDPFFELLPREGDYIGPLTTLLELMVQSGCSNGNIRIHWRWHEDRNKRPDSQRYSELLPAHIEGLVPKGYVLQLYQWEEKSGGEDLHDRFFLTDCGGLNLGAGFSADGAHQTVTISLLDSLNAEEIRSRFDPSANIYNLADKIIQLNDDGSIDLI